VVGNPKTFEYRPTKLILPVVWYGYESCLFRSEEHRLRVYDNRVLRGIFGQRREDIGGVYRKLHNGELHNMYFLPHINGMSILRRIRWGGACSTHRRKKFMIRDLRSSQQWS
jgi:hypothetical protein